MKKKKPHRLVDGDDTTHLLSTEANRIKLAEAIKRAREGKFEIHPIIEEKEKGA